MRSRVDTPSAPVPRRKDSSEPTGPEGRTGPFGVEVIEGRKDRREHPWTTNRRRTNTAETRRTHRRTTASPSLRRPRTRSPTNKTRTRATDGDQGDDESADDAIKRQVEEAVERFDPQPGVTAPLDHVRDDEKDIEPAGVMPAAGPEGTAGEPTEGEPTED